MAKELICPKCGVAYMGDPWVDDYCESCRSSIIVKDKHEQSTESIVDDIVVVEAGKALRHTGNADEHVPSHPWDANLN